MNTKDRDDFPTLKAYKDYLRFELKMKPKEIEERLYWEVKDKAHKHATRPWYRRGWCWTGIVIGAMFLLGLIGQIMEKAG